MPKYKFVALDAVGAEVKGSLDAPNEATVRRDLLHRNLDVQLVKIKKTLNVDISPQRVPLTEVMHFSRQMSAFVRSGIPLMDGIDVIADGTNNKRFREILLSECWARIS